MNKSIQLTAGQAVPNGYVAAPSPSGTNFEGLYVPRSWLHPAANDAAPVGLRRRTARDQELEDMFVIAPSHPWWKQAQPTPGRSLPSSFRYASDTNGLVIITEVP